MAQQFAITFGNDRVLMVQGPLSTACTNILDEELQKKNIEGVGIESMQEDGNKRNSAFLALMTDKYNLSPSRKEMGLAYGVSESDVSQTHVIEFTDAITSMDDDAIKKSVLYLDTPNISEMQPVAAMLADIADTNGVEVAVSKEEFVEIVRRKYRL